MKWLSNLSKIKDLKTTRRVKSGKWIQTLPDRFVILRFYSPLESFFTKTRRPSEIEPVK